MAPEPRFLNVEYFFYKFYLFLLSLFGIYESESLRESLRFYLNVIWVLCLIVSALAFWGTFYYVRKISAFRRIEREAYFNRKEEVPVETSKEEGNKAWAEVIKHLSSDNPANWKLAVIEADKMLDEVLSTLGYLGASVGDKLKSVPAGFLRSVDDAWEAHKVRNQIAHEPNFELTEREARIAISRYERVFRELELI